MQGQEAKGDHCRGRDFRHQEAQGLEFGGHFGRPTLARDTKTAFSPRTPKRSPRFGCKNWRNPQLFSRVKGIVALLTIAGSLTIAACSVFGPGEAVRDESGRTLYRAAEENPADAPDVAPVREKVPGESR